MPGEDTWLGVAAIVVGGCGAILLVAGIFYEVGRSEDRERAAAERRRAGELPPPRAADERPRRTGLHRPTRRGHRH